MKKNLSLIGLLGFLAVAPSAEALLPEVESLRGESEETAHEAVRAWILDDRDDLVREALIQKMIRANPSNELEPYILIAAQRAVFLLDLVEKGASVIVENPEFAGRLSRNRNIGKMLIEAGGRVDQVGPSDLSARDVAPRWVQSLFPKRPKHKTVH